MSFAKLHNTAVASFNFETPAHFTYQKPVDLAQEKGLDHVYKVNAIYINRKGKYGDEPVIITDECIVNAPSHLVDTVKNILTDENSVKLINDGKVGFKLYEYENKKGVQHGLTWVDL